ncbi:oxidoreductase [Actinokineospora auranticolor]|uniref:oxidoreductase n=1 Tax=Actinokineospora auranticolor TaxID=155976 RepID=UPI000CECBE7C|nr:oxidoreductase [Actinokineospora auranticolor]
MTDPLAPLLDLPGITDAVAAARDAVADVHRHPTNRRGWPATAAEASVRAARASAVLDGGDPEIPEEGEVRDPVLAGALRVAEALGPLLPTWERAPMQALAKLHVLAAADLTDEESLGRPRAGLGVTSRLDLLAGLVAGGTKVPGPVLAAIVHGELLALTPFGTADGVVARAAARLTLIGTGLDPKGLAVPEVAFMRRRDHYGALADGFTTGDPDAIAAWIVFCCEAVQAGAREATSIADAATG